MAFLVSLALGWKWPGWVARLFGWAAPLLVAAMATTAAIWLIYDRGRTSGAADLRAKTEQAHTRAIADARNDERQAAAVTDAIGRRVAKADDQTTTLVRSKITEIHDDLASTGDGPDAGRSADAVFDAGGVRASLNALVDHANRAADAADAER